MGLPVVSPTAVLLGIASTLFCLGKANQAKRFLENVHKFKVVLDPPDGVIFFRAFHQLRRYETDKWDKRNQPANPRIGMTRINQGTREYGIPEGPMTIFIGVPEEIVEDVKLALINRDHVGTHDSLCSLLGDVQVCPEPTDVLFCPVDVTAFKMPAAGERVTAVTLSKFSGKPIQDTDGKRWWMAGEDNTQLVAYILPGQFIGTSHGKIYRKR